MAGSIHPRGTMFLREAAGEASSPNGETYELATAINNGVPLVRSKQSGKTFSLDWCEIIDMAKAAGIDKPD